MRFLEVRRHTMRLKPSQHISQSGVTLARRVGENCGPFDHVVSSPVIRAYETALSMGFAVNEEIEVLAPMSDDLYTELDGDVDFAAFAAALKRDGAAATFVRQQAEVWHSLLRGMTDGGRVLAVTHGGNVEAGAVGCLPNADHAEWGHAIDCCEGVRLAFDGANFVRIIILRVDQW